MNWKGVGVGAFATVAREVEDGHPTTHEMSSEQRSMHPILERLKGGDRRSIGKSNTVVAIVLKEPGLFDVLFSGMFTDDPLIRMRSADAAEKVTAVHPEYLTLYKTSLLKSLANVEQAEVRWHVAPMLARLPLSKSEQAAVIDVLTGYMNDRSSIVRTMAMQALYDLAERYEALRPVALLHIKELVSIGTPAMKARGRKLLTKLDRLTTASTRTGFSAGAPKPAGQAERSARSAQGCRGRSRPCAACGSRCGSASTRSRESPSVG